MPDMDGYQATALIRADEGSGKLPIIAMTAHAVAGYRERCLEMDMNDYVTKPIDPDTLYAVLATWVEPDPGRVDVADLMPAGAARLLSPAIARRGIDMGAAMERLGGHGRLLSQLLGMFAKDFSATLQQVQDAIHCGDLSKAADLVHKVRGAAGNISATELYDTATALEDRLRDDAPAPADLLLAFAQAFDIVMQSALQDVADHQARPAELAPTT